MLTGPPAESDDVDLMRRVAAHDSAGLAAIYDRHATLLHSVLLKMLADPAEAQDLLHDMFLSLPQRASSYDPGLGKPVAWLITLARNRAIDRLRRRTTHQRFVTQATGESDGTQAPFWRMNIVDLGQDGTLRRRDHPRTREFHERLQALVQRAADRPWRSPGALARSLHSFMG